MALIKRETLEKMWGCYREIAACEKLLADIAEVKKNDHFKQFEGKLKDAFGGRHDFQMGVPCGESGHRIFGLSSELAMSVITSHKAKMEALLIETNEQAKIEINL
jgi:hypothetical protein